MTNEEAIQILREEGCGNCSEGYLHPYDCPNNECDVQAALDLAISALSRDRWISVEEPPEETGWYLVRCNQWGGNIHRISFFDLEGCYWMEWSDKSYDITEYVTHWMPLPEPPKEET